MRPRPAQDRTWLRQAGQLILCGVCSLALTGCSIRKYAVNQLGSALASSGETFTSDDDPELVKAALPFSLKLMESLLAESPHHQPLLLATSAYFTQFAYGFVQQEADELEGVDFSKADAMRRRAQKLFIRARDYGLRALDVRRAGFANRLRRGPATAVKELKRKDVPEIYWTAVAWGLAISPDNPSLVAEQPIVEALIDRAFELDEDFGAGALHGFLIRYEMIRQNAPGDPVARARNHFERALALGGGNQAAPYVTYAEAVAVKTQNLSEFESSLEAALAIDADEYPPNRLANLISQRRAQWLLSRKAELFLSVPPSQDEP